MFLTAVQLMNYFFDPLFSMIENINQYNSIKEQVPNIKGYDINKCYTQIDNLEFKLHDKITLNILEYSHGDESNGEKSCIQILHLKRIKNI